MEVENIRKSFWRLKEGGKGKNFDKKVNSLTRYKIGGRWVVVVVVPFFFVHFSFCQPNSELRSAFGLASLEKMQTKLFFFVHFEILFKHGHFDAGRIKYEQLLEQFPKRFDILMIYIDMEIKRNFLFFFQK